MSRLNIYFFLSVCYGCSSLNPEPTLVTPSAAVFNDYTSYITIANNASINPTDAISISMWLYLTEPIDCDIQNNWRGLLNKSFAFATLTGYDVIIEDDRILTWDVGTEGGEQRYNGGVITEGKWTHLTFIYNSANAVSSTYIDGVEVGGTYWTQGSGKIKTNTFNLILNKASATCPNSLGHVPGYYDEISLWNIALTSEQVNFNMNNVLTGMETGLISYWSLDEDDNGYYKDIASGNHGVRTGNVKLEPSCLPFFEDLTTTNGCVN
ncbi:MAG: LamG domain-containing protein [Cyclobacteriaceae bacterium]|nr:LamG domain-containing protein [Cyclobacteriaceae bacterium]